MCIRTVTPIYYVVQSKDACYIIVCNFVSDGNFLMKFSALYSKIDWVSKNHKHFYINLLGFGRLNANNISKKVHAKKIMTPLT